MSVGKIQRTPLAFLQYLGMVGTGVPPTAMADDVRTVVDVTPFYDANLITPVSSTGTITNVGDFVELPVPNGEMWLLMASQFGVSAGAIGDSAICSLQLRLSTNVIRVSTFPAVKTAVTAAARLQEGFVWPRPWLLKPGEALRVTLDDGVLAAGRPGQCNSIVVRIPS